MINFRIISNLLGVLLAIIGIFMFTAIPFSIYYKSDDAIPLLISGLITYTVGIILWKIKRSNGNGNSNAVRRREGFMIVALGWIAASAFGSLPFILSGATPSVTDAFFESVSGFTTTGASILNDIEFVPKGILFWRSLTQWIGGMGIIVITIAIMPILGIGGMELFGSEDNGPTTSKIHPRIKETVKRLWAIYLGLTIILFFLLWKGNMSFFDAANHALTTMATGGFSTRQANIAYYDSPFIQYVIIFFMILAGTNFTLIYYGFKGRFSKLRNDDEFKTYIKLCLFISIIIACVLFFINNDGIEKNFRDALFQVVSIITSTGFITADYTKWAPFLTLIFFALLFVGGSAGSTSGGIKIVRHCVIAKNSFLEFKRLLHHRAVIPVKLNSKIVADKIITNVLVFVLVYITIFVAGSMILSATGIDFDTSIGAVAASLGNVGPGTGSVGPACTFAHINDFGKWLLSFLMILGRLELFTVLIIFTYYH